MNAPKSGPHVPQDRATSPDSLTAIAHRLDSIDQGQKDIKEQLARLLLATYDAVNETLIVKQDNVKINAEVAGTRRRVEDLEAWRNDVEERLRALESGA